MTVVNQLTALEEGNANNSNGADIASSVNALRDNDLAKDALISGIVETPVGLTLPAVLSGLSVYKKGDKYTSSIRPIDLIDTRLITKIIHVDINTGDDSNTSGSTWQNAVKSIWRAIEIALAPSIGISSRIFIKGGTYPRENGFLKDDASWAMKNISITFEAKYGRVLTGAFSNNAWLLESGQTNTYVCTNNYPVIGVNPSLPVNLTNLQQKGKPGHTQYRHVTSIAEVESGEGTIWVSGTSVYVHPHGSVPATNANVRIMENRKTLSGSAFGDMYFRGIDTEGGRLGFIYSTSANLSQGKLVTDNCSHRYCIGGTFSTPVPWAVFSVNDFSLKAHFDTDSSYNSADGFSVSGSGTNQNCSMLVVNGVSSYNGLLTQYANTSNKPNSVNGFTAHNGLVAISVGGEYIGTAGTPIAIVHDNTRAWVLGAMAGDSEGDKINGKAIDIGGASAANVNCKLWLDSTTLYGCDRELLATSDGEILLRNHTGSGEEVAVTGTITNY